MILLSIYYKGKNQKKSTPLETRAGHETQPHELFIPFRDKSLTGFIFLPNRSKLRAPLEKHPLTGRGMFLTGSKASRLFFPQLIHFFLLTLIFIYV